MKKICLLMSALALGLFAMTSCDKGGENGGLDLDNITLDGIYVYGEGVGTTEFTPEYMMGQGFNEVTKKDRSGMYEKYIYIEKDKGFELLLKEGNKATRYSAELEDFNAGDFPENPQMLMKRGKLQTGDQAPQMKVEESGMYHIILDINEAGDLEYPQIVLAKADWGLIIGGSLPTYASNKFPEPKVENGGRKVTYTLTGVRLVEKNKIKFGHCDGWKINLDAAGTIKAETSLGVDDDNLYDAAKGTPGKLKVGTYEIPVKPTGLQTISLIYELKGGKVEESFSYTIKCTEKINPPFPEELYLIGEAFGNNDWNSEDIVTLNKVASDKGTGLFWTVRYLEKGKKFKFSGEKNWDAAFIEKGQTDGLVKIDGPFGADASVKESGLYMLYVDYNKDFLLAEPAKICGMGDAFGNWNAGEHPFTIAADGTASIKTTAKGNLRMYAELSVEGKTDWWTREFNIYDGKIVYRGNGNDQAPVPVEANKTITLNFNAGTATIK